MQKHRYIKYGLWMSEEEDHSLQKICDQSGLSRAAVLRKMIRLGGGPTIWAGSSSLWEVQCSRLEGGR